MQLSVEAVDPSWSTLVGPYAPLQVLLSGSAQPIVLGVTQRGDVQQDILMSGSATETADAGETGSFDAPRTLSKDGEWIGSLSGYGNADYFVLNGQSNRTMAVEITALDENGNVTEQKAQPVIGMWSLAAPDRTPPPAYTFSPFNIGHLGVTRLSAELLSGTQFRIGITDLRGDGRPDYRYRAHVLYGDTVTPARVSVQPGTPIALAGLGFKPGDTVAVGGTNSTLVGVSPTQLTALAPPLVDGVQSITITDPVNGASTTLENAVTAGPGPNDLIRMALSGQLADTGGGRSSESPTSCGGYAGRIDPGHWRNRAMERQQWRGAFGVRRRGKLPRAQRRKRETRNACPGGGHGDQHGDGNPRAGVVCAGKVRAGVGERHLFGE
jgi:hypothetical protein